MKQENNDVVLKVITEWNQYEARMNFDVSGDELVRVFANMMRSMTYTSYTVMESLRNAADEIEEEMKLYNDINKDDDYGTAN